MVFNRMGGWYSIGWEDSRVGGERPEKYKRDYKLQ